jgi:FkbM family methyltransferase
MSFNQIKYKFRERTKTAIFILTRGRYNPYGVSCFGQDGEDMLLNRIFGMKNNGFYVDIGAHHPFRFSNTYNLYRRGWTGINVDAEPGSMLPFERHRKRDINIECGVGKSKGMFTYYRFNESALNTFNSTEAELKNKLPNFVLNETQIMVQPLGTLLDLHLPPGQTIDFLSIDVEGNEYDVLTSNNWDLYRPEIILAETLRTDILTIDKCPVVQFLLTKKYQPFAKIGNTTFFRNCAALI